MKKLDMFSGAFGLIAMAVQATPAMARPMPVFNQGDCLRNTQGSTLCMNQTVASRNSDNRGLVVGLYTDGTVIVRMSEGVYQNTNQNFRADELTAEVPALGGLVRGGIAKSRASHNRGTVVAVFDSGMAKVQLIEGPWSSAGPQVFKAGTLAAPLQCLQTVCEGDQVISRTNSSNLGTVENVFEDGIAIVHMTAGFLTGTNQYYEERNLGVMIGGHHHRPQPDPIPVPVPAPFPPIVDPWNPAPIPVPVPVPVPPVPVPGPDTNPAGPHFGGRPCSLAFCQQGAVCSNGCPIRGTCSYVRADIPYWRVVACRR